jgi:hypothetical protein
MASGPKIEDAAPLAIHEVRFEGRVLQGGFWLYVWEVTPADKAPLYYVGRTGDSSSTNGQSPFNRMGQHLGFAKNSNMLRRHLTQHGAVPESCALSSGLTVMNRVVSRKPLDEARFAQVRTAFEKAFPQLAAATQVIAPPYNQPDR